MKKGFTLIELLAVIVILAIIAVIAVPIVLNIINDTKENATLRSADFYLDGVEKSIATSMLNNIDIKDGIYPIMEDGNVCIGTLENNTCTGEILKVEMDGEVPKEGTIKIKDGQINKIDVTLSSKEVWMDPFDRNLEYKLAPGVYDKNDKLLVSWDELNQIALEKNYYNGSNFEDAMQEGHAVSNMTNEIKDAYKLVIADSVPTIAIGAFANIDNLAIIIISDSVTSIDKTAFERSTSLEKIYIPSSVTTIGDWAFTDSTKLTTVIMEEGVTSIGEWAFAGTAITEITIPNSVTSIGLGAFSGSSLETITIPNGVIKELSQTFQSCHNLREVIIGEGVTSIHSGVFNDCPSLVSVKLPTTLTSIWAEAFKGCLSLKEIIIPSSVTEIGEDVFQDCPSLTTIYYKGIATGAPWGAENARVVTNF